MLNLFFIRVMTTPFLSVIMLVYNSELFLKEAIESILKQTFSNLELIVIDDGSSDSSRQIIESFDDARIKILYNKTNKGIVYSRNKGLENSKGKYIAMFDSDDVADPSKFEKQIVFLENNPAYGMIGSWVEIINSAGKSKKTKFKLDAKSSAIPSILFFRNYFINSASVFRQAIVKDFVYPKGYNIGEDYYLWIYISKRSKVWNLQESLVKYRIHSNSVTKQNDNLKKADRKIFSYLFNEMDIPQVEQDFESHMIIKDNEKINQKEELKKVEEWINLLYFQNKRVKVYKQKIFIKILFNRWLKVIKKSRQLGVYTLLRFIKSRILWLRIFQIISLR